VCKIDPAVAAPVTRNGKVEDSALFNFIGLIVEGGE